MNLFWATRSMTDAKEDHLTEFFAAGLELSPRMRSGYFNKVLKRYADAKGWGRCRIKKIDTQMSFDNSTCCPDMLLTLTNGKRIICEHKIEAVEGNGPECDERRQLERYVDLPVDGVAFVRASWKPPTRRVLRHPKYIRPADREHFLWRDFYDLLEVADCPFLEWLREGFRYLGFTPAHPCIGDLEGPDEEQVKANRLNFAKLWTLTRKSAADDGWYSNPGAIVQLYLGENPHAIASEIFIQPKGDSLQFRVTPRRGQQGACLKRLERARRIQPIFCESNRGNFELGRNRIARVQRAGARNAG